MERSEMCVQFGDLDGTSEQKNICQWKTGESGISGAQLIIFHLYYFLSYKKQTIIVENINTKGDWKQGSEEYSKFCLQFF